MSAAADQRQPPWGRKRGREERGDDQTGFSCQTVVCTSNLLIPNKVPKRVSDN